MSKAIEAVAAAVVKCAAWVGVDWADKKHNWSMRVEGKTSVERGELKNTPEAIHIFVSELSSRFPGEKIGVALEQSRGAVLFQLSKYEQFVLYPIHPNTLDHYRKSFYPSGAKSDPCDADLILELLCQHGDRLRSFAPDDVPTRTLQFMVEARRAAVDDNTRSVNRLTGQLKLFYPQVLDWFKEMDSPLTCDWLKKWPTLEQAQNQKPAKVRTFLKTHRYSSEHTEKLLDSLPQSIPATKDQAVIEAGLLIVKHLLGQIEVLRTTIQEYDKRIKLLTDAHPDQAIFASFPSAGEVMVPRLIAGWGTQRERYDSAASMQSFSGIAPVVERSGNKEWIHWRWACPKFLRQTFHEWAWLSTRSSPWAREYYDKQRAKGKGHHASVRALAFKWIRIMFRCWKDHCPYDEARYVAQLKKRCQPLSKAAAPPSSVGIQWKNDSGLFKPGPVSA
jgi:Transposase/Transposase IS116/IS110/IS902 family